MTVLVVDDDAVVAEYCREILSEAGHSVLVVTTGKDALAALDGHEIDVVLSDVRMPDMNGVDLLRSISPGNTGPDVVLMTGFASISSAVEAMRLGAYDYLVKPFVPGQFEATIQRLAELRALRTENLVLRLQLDSARGIGGMVGGSPAMLGVFKAVSRIAGKRQPVLITGETGTGKELVARAIHDQGPDKDRPFVAVDCGALSPEIVESEIFGHVRGAFTGAIGDRPGLLASAAHGTFFLDEVGELSLALQAKFFRALQDREFRPLGSDAVRRFEGRVIAATNRDLEAAVKAGSFRPELFFRLCVHPVHVPPAAGADERHSGADPAFHPKARRGRCTGDRSPHGEGIGGLPLAWKCARTGKLHSQHAGKLRRARIGYGRHSALSADGASRRTSGRPLAAAKCRTHYHRRGAGGGGRQYRGNGAAAGDLEGDPVPEDGRLRFDSA
jgi:DNA-binding NtrC family response regulator